MSISPSDPRLTAYALGELDAAEAEEIERALEHDDDLRRRVREIRAAADAVERHLSREPLPERDSRTADAVKARRDQPVESIPSAAPAPTIPGWHTRRLAAVAAVLVVLVAGALAVMNGWMERERHGTGPVARTGGMPGNEASTGPGAADEKASRVRGRDQSVITADGATLSADVSGGSVAGGAKAVKELGLVRQFITENTPTSGVASSALPQAGATDARTAGEPDASKSPAPAYDYNARVSTPSPAAAAATPAPAPPPTAAGPGLQPLPGEVVDDAEGRDLEREVKPQHELPESDKGKSEERRDLPAAPATQPLPADHDGHNREQYDAITHNPFLDAKSNPLSTFSIDVDTASYANVRRLLNTNLLPPAGAARIEEMVNYFKYDYPAPDMKSETPFSVNVEVAPCPWRPKNRLARIGLRGKTFADDERPAANLVFLLDVSGSMKQPNKLPWVIASMQMLTRQLREKDRVAIAVYAGASGLVLDSTLCTEGGKETVQAALGRLQAGGSTNGGDGIRLAYKVAQEQFVKSGANRVILCTDGDWNVGTTNTSDLTDLITEKAKSGVFLTVLGFGMGNYNDGMLEKLADKGNGNYGYIDTVGEAARLLVEQAGGTLFTIAKDVKIQVEFNPKEVGAYRLIGYENRVLAARDFNDDKKDAGEIGAGHTVTALYELTPPGVATPGGDVDPLRYQQAGDASDKAETGEMFVVKLRYKKPDGDVSTKVEHPVREQKKSLGDTSRDFRFASAVAAFGMILRRAPEDIRGGATYALVSELATEAAGQDDSRREFLTLVAKAQALDTGR